MFLTYQRWAQLFELRSGEHSPKSSQTVRQIQRPEKGWTSLVSEYQLDTCPYNVYRKLHLVCKYRRKILWQRLQESKNRNMDP
jgi:hypothetical protein